ncbi:N-acetylglucosamine-6-phosphate deacetylase [Treponema sp.]
MNFIIEGALVSFDDGLRPASVHVIDGHIAAVARSWASTASPAVRIEKIDGRGCILSSGFIDLHCHGGAGADVNDGSREALATLASYHFSHGVTALTPSLSVDPLPTLEKALDVVRTVRRNAQNAGNGKQSKAGPEILGAHFESPYINPIYKGCQALERLLPFDQAAFSLIKNNSDVIARLTIAPELEGVMEAIPKLCGLGIVVAGGHTNANAATFRAAVDRGLSMATHLYNAMSAVHKIGPFRESGALEAALSDDRVFTELIADGRHVSPEQLRIAYRCKGSERFLVCSDASRGAGFSGGDRLFICGQEAIIEEGVATLADRSSLASSVSSLDHMVRVLVKEAGLSIHQALHAASAVPAKAIGLADRKGKIAVGYDADLVLLDSELEVQAVWGRGRGGFLDAKPCP